MSGATWSPNTVTYAGNNRTHMIRIPDAGRFELRLADGAANPYLLQAAVLAAGLDGIEKARDPGKRLDINMYTEGIRSRMPRSCRLTCLTRCGRLSKSAVLKKPLVNCVASYREAETRRLERLFAAISRIGNGRPTLDC